MDSFMEYYISGVSYLDFPANLLSVQVARGSILTYLPCPPPPLPRPSSKDLQKALHLILNSKRPLVIVGKGMDGMEHVSIKFYYNKDE
jgi:thiamine pyrophosphate-dependent acetolactate synthase large subunit-like protein